MDIDAAFTLARYLEEAEEKVLRDLRPRPRKQEIARAIFNVIRCKLTIEVAKLENVHAADRDDWFLLLARLYNQIQQRLHDQ